MGHANLENISKIFNKMVKRPDGATIREVVDFLEASCEKVHASEGDYEERFMLSDSCEEIAAWLREGGAIEPTMLTKEQKPIFDQWLEGDIGSWDNGKDGEGGEYGILDSVRWKANKKALPILRFFTR